MEECEFVVAVVFVEDVIEFRHEAEADGVGEAGAPGNDEATFPFVIAEFGAGGDFNKGHEGESGVAFVVSVEVPLEAHRDVSESVGVVAIRVKVDDGLEVHVVGETGFKVKLPVSEGFITVVAAVVEERGFESKTSGIDREGGFCGIGTVGGEVAEEVVGGGVTEGVDGFV